MQLKKIAEVRGDGQIKQCTNKSGRNNNRRDWPYNLLSSNRFSMKQCVGMHFVCYQAMAKYLDYRGIPMSLSHNRASVPFGMAWHDWLCDRSNKQNSTQCKRNKYSVQPLTELWKMAFNFQQRSSRVCAINGNRMCMQLECWHLPLKIGQVSSIIIIFCANFLEEIRYYLLLIRCLVANSLFCGYARAALTTLYQPRSCY